MSDKEHEIPVKVVDRRWWANKESQDNAGASASSTSLKPTYVEELEQRLQEKDRQLQDAVSRYRQASSEFDESRLRLRREISKEIERGRREILAELLDVVDNLDRAIAAAQRSANTDGMEALVQGVDLVRRQFLAKLEGFGVTRIESEGQPFDPSLHEAVSTVPASAPDQDGVVVGVIRQGYRIGQDVLRPAAVAVAKN
jgi:molecular chaperone GrpE